MSGILSQALSACVSKHIFLSASRRETLCWLVATMLSACTTSLWRLAPQMAMSCAEVSSVYRRLARFFQHVRVDGACFARLVVSLLGLTGSDGWDLVLDRTNWKLGKTHINILMLGVMWRGVCIPLFWSVLDKAGNSNTDERIALVQRLQETFPEQALGSLMGDREFIGKDWMGFLQQRRISFVLRLREDMSVFNESHAPVSLAHVAHRLRKGETMILKGTWRLGRNDGDASPHVRIVILRLDNGELLALATDKRPKSALARYRSRWAIETLFCAMKSRGFDLEATHITQPEKLALLIGILAIATALAYKTGMWATTLRPTPLKKHGKPAKSIFRRGLDTLKKILASNNQKYIQSILRAILETKQITKSLIINNIQMRVL